MSRLATILTARTAPVLACAVAALLCTAMAHGQPTAPATPVSTGSAAPKSPATSSANQPVLSPRDPVAPASPVAPPVSPAAPATVKSPDDQKLIDLARQLSSTSPAAPAATAGAAGTSGKTTENSDKTLPAKREKNATAAPVSTMNSTDSRPLSARRRAESPDVEAGAAGSSAGDAAGGGWMLTGAALVGVVGLIFFLRAGLSRWMGGVSAVNRSAVVQVLARVAVAPRNHVLLLRVGSRVLVVGDSATGMRTLAQIDDAEEIADILAAASSTKPNSISAGFRQLLSGFSGEYNRDERAAVGSDEQEANVDRARDKVGGLVGKIRGLAGKGGEA